MWLPRHLPLGQQPPALAATRQPPAPAGCGAPRERAESLGATVSGRACQMHRRAPRPICPAPSNLYAAPAPSRDRTRGTAHRQRASRGGEPCPSRSLTTMEPRRGGGSRSLRPIAPSKSLTKLRSAQASSCSSLRNARNTLIGVRLCPEIQLLAVPRGHLSASANSLFGAPRKSSRAAAPTSAASC